MAWIYLAVSEESQKPWKATCGQSPIVKTIDMQSASSYRACPAAICPSLLFGTTLLPCKGASYHDLSISSMEDFPAKTLASLDAERVWKESEADYFLRSSGSLAKYDHVSCSWKTSGELFPSSREYAGKWNAWGMTLAGEYYPLTTWERRTKETDGGCWPTPTVQDAENTGGGSQYQRNSIPLNALVKMFPTPVASGKLNGGTRDFQRLHDLKNVGQITEAERRSMSQGNGGKLNPQWVAWLMGYHTGWTSLEPWAIAWFRPVRGKRLKD